MLLPTRAQRVMAHQGGSLEINVHLNIQGAPAISSQSLKIFRHTLWRRDQMHVADYCLESITLFLVFFLIAQLGMFNYPLQSRRTHMCKRIWELFTCIGIQVFRAKCWSPTRARKLSSSINCRRGQKNRVPFLCAGSRSTNISFILPYYTFLKGRQGCLRRGRISMQEIPKVSDHSFIT